MILVVIQAGEADRVSEGLRAGIGLGLRGDEVGVILSGPAARFASGAGEGDGRIARALRTLGELGRPAEVVEEAELPRRMRSARAVEVWTSSSRSGSPAGSGSQSGMRSGSGSGSRSGPDSQSGSDFGSESGPPSESATGPASRSASRPRRLQLGGGELEIWPHPPRFRQPRGDGAAAPVDGRDLVAQILGSNGPVVLW